MAHRFRRLPRCIEVMWAYRNWGSPCIADVVLIHNARNRAHTSRAARLRINMQRKNGNIYAKTRTSMQRQEHLCKDKNIYAKKNLPKHENKKTISQKTTVFCDVLFFAPFSCQIRLQRYGKKIIYANIFVIFFVFIPAFVRLFAQIGTTMTHKESFAVRGLAVSLCLKKLYHKKRSFFIAYIYSVF